MHAKVLICQRFNSIEVSESIVVESIFTGVTANLSFQLLRSKRRIRAEIVRFLIVDPKARELVELTGSILNRQ